MTKQPHQKKGFFPDFRDFRQAWKTRKIRRRVRKLKIFFHWPGRLSARASKRSLPRLATFLVFLSKLLSRLRPVPGYLPSKRSGQAQAAANLSGLSGLSGTRVLHPNVVRTIEIGERLPRSGSLPAFLVPNPQSVRPAQFQARLRRQMGSEVDPPKGQRLLFSTEYFVTH
jgi:hypothetical protein